MMERNSFKSESLSVSERMPVGDAGKSGVLDLDEVDFVDDGYLEIHGNLTLHIKKLLNDKTSKRIPYEFYIVGDDGKPGQDSINGEDGSPGEKGVQTTVEIIIDNLKADIHVVTIGGRGGDGGSGIDGFRGGKGMDAEQGCYNGQFARGASGGDGTDGFGDGGDGGDGGDAPGVTILWKRCKKGAKILCESRPSEGGKGGHGGKGGSGGSGGKNGDGRTRAADGKTGISRRDGVKGAPGKPTEVRVIHEEKEEAL